MRKEKLNIVACQHRFWKLLAKYAPNVCKDLFVRSRGVTWRAAQWGARRARLDLDPDNPRGTGPHPAALAWCDHWKLPDWCLALAERALRASFSRQLKTAHYREMDRWRKAISHSIYYSLKPPPFEFTVSLWPARSAYKPLTGEECRERILTVVAKAADEYFDKHVATFPWPDLEEFRKLDKHCQWLILNKWGGQTQAQIADQASQGRKQPYTEAAISSAIVKLAKRLGFPDDAKDNLGTRK